MSGAARLTGGKELSPDGLSFVIEKAEGRSLVREDMRVWEVRRDRKRHANLGTGEATRLQR